MEAAKEKKWNLAQR